MNGWNMKEPRSMHKTNLAYFIYFLTQQKLIRITVDWSANFANGRK